MGALKTKILTYSPEQYYPNDSAYTGTTLANSGSGATGTWNKTGGTPTLNATGGPDGAGCWQFSVDNTAETSLRIFGSLTSGYPYSGQLDGDYSSGFWFRIPTTITALSETVIDIGRVGGSSTSATLSMYTGASNTGKLTSAQPTSITSTTRYDDGLWHYYAERLYNNGTNLTKERYLDGTLWHSGTTTNTSSIAYLQMADNSITNSTSPLTYIEIAHLYATTSSSINATAISEIWTAGQASAVDITINETPATASGLMVDPTLSLSINKEETSATASALMTEPTIAVTSGDHTEITTSISVSAEFPSNIVAAGNVNVNIVVTEILTASIEMINNVDISTGTDISWSALEMTATALFVDPIFSREAMTASALFSEPSISVSPSYFKIVKDDNPVFYTNLDQTTITNYGSWGINHNTTVGSTITKEVDSGGKMGIVGEGDSWQFNGSYYNAPNRIIINGPDAATIGDLFNDDFTIEYWFSKETTSNDGVGVKFNFIEIIYSDDAYSGVDDKSFVLKVNNLEPYATTTGAISTTKYFTGVGYAYNTWNHVVLQGKKISGNSSYDYNIIVALNGNVSISANVKTNGNWYNSYVANPEGIRIIGSRWDNSQNDNATTGAGYLAKFDEIAIYDRLLTNSEILEHHGFINILSPDRTVYPSVLTSFTESGDHNFTVTSNAYGIAIPITASVDIINPIVIPVKNIDYSASTLTASALNTDVTVYWGWTIYATPATVYAERPEAYFLNDLYYQYVQTNFAPYRYVTFDSADAGLDYGTDLDYSVTSTSIGGTVVNPDLGINGKSIKTTGSSYITDGVILNESEWNDDWGTGNNDYISSFWIQRALDDNSTTGLRVLWNLNGYKDNQHVVVYHYQNKLHFQINNQSGTHHTVTSTNNVNIFDYNRHHIVIYSHFNNNHNYISIYVDGVSIIGAHDIGNYKITTLNASSADSGANNESNNHPRLSVGCLITPFGSTALPVLPTNTKLIIDEIFWDKDAINQTQVTNLYNAMPDKNNKTIIVEPFIASDELVMPAISTQAILSIDPATVSAELIDPSLYIERFIINTADLMEASALMTTAIAFQNADIVSDVMIATAIFNSAGVIISIPGGPMLATVTLVSRKIYMLVVDNAGVDNFVAPGLQLSPWSKYIRSQDGTSRFAQVLNGMREIK